eukprot:scaffold13788_cov29-Tisochrysis_lutea.AAC.2
MLAKRPISLSAAPTSGSVSALSKKRLRSCSPPTGAAPDSGSQPAPRPGGRRTYVRRFIVSPSDDSLVKSECFMCAGSIWFTTRNSGYVSLQPGDGTGSRIRP